MRAVTLVAAVGWSMVALAPVAAQDLADLAVAARRLPTKVVASVEFDAPSTVVLVRVRSVWPSGLIFDLLGEPSARSPEAGPTPPPLGEGGYFVVVVSAPRPISVAAANQALDELDVASPESIGKALARQWSEPGRAAKWAVVEVPPSWDPDLRPSRE